MTLKKALIYCLIFYTFSLHALELPLLVKDGDLNIALEGVHVSVQNISQPPVLTDADGRALLNIPEDASFPLSIICTTPGYTDTRIELKRNSLSFTHEKPLVIVMGLDTILEGEELVVEASRKGKTDQKTGVSIVRTSEEMETTAQIGIIADVMTSVATLPGVGFKLGMNTEPSIRGGYPAEMGVTFDGMYLLKPFYWDGMVSILSPYMVDTIKLSTGIFSSRYGQGISGLFDTTSKKIDERKTTLNISTISADAAFELPLGEKNNLFLYVHATDLTTVKWFTRYVLPLFFTNEEYAKAVSSSLDIVKRMPYVYSVYGKWEFTPVPDFSLDLQTLFAVDGLELLSEQEWYVEPSWTIPDWVYDNVLYEPLISIDSVNYFNIQSYSALNLNWLVTEKLLFNVLGSYAIHQEVTNNHFYNCPISFSVLDMEGNPEYRDPFFFKQTEDIDQETKTLQQIQGKVQSDILLTPDSILSFGAEEVYKSYLRDLYTVNRDINYLQNWDDPEELPTPVEDVLIQQSSTALNSMVNSSLFALWAFGIDTSMLEGEIGLRGEHFYLWNKEAGFNMISYPVANPRARLVFTPVQNKGPVSRFSLSAGSGLYSAVSETAQSIQKDSSAIASLVPDTAWTSVAGSELELEGDFRLSLEGYYKYYLNRMYVYSDERDLDNVIWHTCSDGLGFTTGADVMIEKKISTWFSGYLSYSFLYARFYNPSVAQYPAQTTVTDDPLGIWYYPYFHRFHTVHGVLNFYLPKNYTITLAASYATGAPRKVALASDFESYAEYGDDVGFVYDTDLDIRGKFNRVYSNTERYNDDWPIDFRLSRKGTFKNPKKTWEWYFGVENMIGFIVYMNRTMRSMEEDTVYETNGWIIGEGRFEIDMGMLPIPSFGVKFQL